MDNLKFAPGRPYPNPLLSRRAALLLLGLLVVFCFSSVAVGGRWQNLLSLEGGLLCALALARPSGLWLIALPATILVADVAGALILPVEAQFAVITQSVIENLQVLLTVFLVERSVGGRFKVRQARDSFVFLALAMAAATPAILPDLFAWGMGSETFLSALVSAEHTIKITLGITTVTPLLLLLFQDTGARLAASRRTEAVILAAALVTGTLLVFAVPTVALGISLGSPPFRYALFPFLIWAAVRFGGLGASLAGMTVTLIVAIQMARRAGPFAGLGEEGLYEAIALVQLYLATLQITSVALGISLEELSITKLALSDSETRFRYATLGSNDGLWKWDSSAQMVELNTRANELLGYSAETTSWSREFAVAQFHPEDSGRLLEVTAACIKEKKSLDEVVRVRTQSGSYRWIHIRGAAFTDPITDRAWLSGSFTDVTEETTRLTILERVASGVALERVLAEIATYLESQLGRAQAAILNAPPGSPFARVLTAPHLDGEISTIIETSAPSPRSAAFGETLYANRRVIIEDLEKVSQKEESALLLKRTGVRAVWSEPVHDGPRMGNITLAVFFLAPRAPTQADLKLLLECASLARIAINRARAAEELRERESAYERTLANVSGVAYRTPPDDKACFTYARGGCFELTGYYSSELTARSDLPFISLVAPEDRARVALKFEHFRTLHDPYELDYRIITRDGATKWVRDQAQGLYDANANLIALEGLLTDITARKKAEEQQRCLEEQLRQATKMEAI
ncbi:MAG: PAS domain S-box protein, partial [Proteobacteria bacterium]|nr:PAS domain S-box protein [Pseudomonadota bacterium]